MYRRSEKASRDLAEVVRKWAWKNKLDYTSEVARYGIGIFTISNTLTAEEQELQKFQIENKIEYHGLSIVGRTQEQNGLVIKVKFDEQPALLDQRKLLEKKKRLRKEAGL